MLNNIKLLLGLDLDNIEKDALLNVLIENAKDEATAFCGLDAYDTKLDSAVQKMVVQTYRKMGSEGITSQSYSDVSESFIDGYSDDVMRILKRYRKIRFL